LATDCAPTDIAVVIVNLRPGLTYNVRLVDAGGASIRSTFTTSDHDDPHLDNLYASIRTETGTFDTTRLDREVHDALLANFSDIVTSGDSILATVSVSGVPKEVM
ncbi:unnamed protein product, partial [Laminaria digitata]